MKQGFVHRNVTDSDTFLLVQIYELIKKDKENANYGVRRIYDYLRLNKGYLGGIYTDGRICRENNLMIRLDVNHPVSPKEWYWMVLWQCEDGEFFVTLKKESFYQIKTLELKMEEVKSVSFVSSITITYAECILPMLAILLPYFAIYLKKLRLLRVFLVSVTKPLLTIPHRIII